MSEYQYYEFQAIDRPLSERELQALRALSSRARITATSFVNDYSWGDFRGSPEGLMAKCFDAFAYLANWGTRRFMLRLPRRLIDLKTVELYCGDKTTSVKASNENIILDFWSDDEDSRGDWVSGEGWLPFLIPLRIELLQGDLRSLYLGWLLRAQREKLTGNTIEPPVPPGIGELSPALKRFAEFLRIDRSLIEVAAGRSAALDKDGSMGKELAAWIRSLSETEKDSFLVRIIEGTDQHIGAEIRQRFQQERVAHSQGGDLAADKRRTVAQLLTAAEQHAKEKKRQAAEKAAQERAQRERAEAIARAAYLDEFAKRANAAWQHVDRLIETKRQKDYDEAIKLLVDLRDLGIRKGQAEHFKGRLQQLRERHSNKPSLRRRMDETNLVIN